MQQDNSQSIRARRRRTQPMWQRLLVASVALVALIVPLVTPVAASAAGNGVLTITMEPVDVTTGEPQTWAGMTGFGVSTRLGYRISYSCSVEDCDNAIVQVSPGPLDPTYNTYRHLLYQAWTAPFAGATISGTDAAGMRISLGNLKSGAAGSFVMNYQWSMSGNAVTSTMQPAQFFPNGFPIVMSATGSSSTISNAPTATAAAVEWRSTIRDPAIAQSNPGTRDSGVDVSYNVTMNSGCLPIRDSAPKGDSRYTCAKSFTVTDHLDPRATFVSATGGGIYDPVAHTITWSTAPAPGLTSPAPAPGWYRPGDSLQHSPRTVVLRYDPESFSPSGTDADYCNFTVPVTNRVTLDMVFLGAGGMSDDSNTRFVEAPRTHDIVCVRPFPKAIFNSKGSTFDGPNRYGNGNSPIVVQPDAEPNEHRWDISVGNQANVPGVAVIEEQNLAIEGTKPFQIQATNGSGVQQANATIAWELNDGTTGTSAGIAIAPAGKWFVSTTITSGPLAGPNLLATGTAQTTFMARISYTVTGNAPIGQTRTNTATGKMTYPDYPALADLDLGSRTHTLQYLEPFSRATAAKTATGTNASGNITIPASGSVTQYWSVYAYNSGNVPGVAVIGDSNLDASGLRVTSLAAVVGSGNTITGTVVQYTLNTGATGTTTVPFTTPTGTWLKSVTVTTPQLQPVNALSTQNLNSSYELRLIYAVPSTTTPGTTWTNTANVTMKYPNMGVADVAVGNVTRTVTYGAAATLLPAISASFIGTGVVDGGGSAVPGRDVTFTMRGTSANIPTDTTFSPQYVFIAPANWKITPGSAAFAADSVPAGVTFSYKTVIVGGVSRQAVVAQWPAGVSFGANVAWPPMTVKAQPTALALSGTSAIATAWAGEATNNWTTAQATFGSAVTDAGDIDSDGVTTEGFATVNATGVTIGSASQLTVVKEICFPNAAAADGCDWVAQPGALVGVNPAATDIEYRVRLVNTGNTKLTNLVAYDVLPYIGDMGTSSTTATTPRGSTFQEKLAQIVSSSGVTLSYSTSTNPCRTEVYAGGPVGCANNWGSTVVGAQAMKITASADVLPGAEVSVRYKASVVSGAGADAIACNSVAAKATQIGVPAEPLAVCATTQEADLEIAVPARLPLQIDRPGVLPFTVTNNGGSQSAPAIVDVTIPAGVRVTNLTPAGWSCVSSTGALVGPIDLTCTAVTPSGDIRNLAKDVPDSLVIPVVPLAGADVCFDATVHGRMSDPDLSNNDASACFDIASVDPAIQLTKDDGKTVVSRGDEYTYTLVLKNRLVGEAVTGAVLTDALPAGLEFVSASDGGTFADGVVTWPGIDLAAAGAATTGGDSVSGAAGSSVTRTVTVRVASTASASIVNTAKATVADPANPTATLTDNASDMDELLMFTVSKSVNAAAEGVFDGDELTYTIVVSNSGTAPFPGAAIWDDLSEILDDADFVPGSASVVVTGSPRAAVADPIARKLTWSGTLAAGSTATITYRVTAKPGGDASLSNAVFTSATGTVCDAATGKDAAGSPCAVTQTYFGPLISKDVQSREQNDDGTWTITYGLAVVNRNPAAAIDYTLTDSLRFGAGIDVLSAAVASGPAGVALTSWSGSGAVTGAVSLPGGASHEYTVVVRADAKALAGTAAAVCADGVAGGFGNAASISLASGRIIATETCAEPTAPSVTKTAAPAVQNADGSWSVVYTVTAVGPADAPAAGLAYTLKDTLDFPTGATVLATTVAGPTGAPINAAFDGSADTALLTAPDRIGAGESRVFTVTVTTAVPAGAVTGSDLACAPAGSGGYANAVVLFSGSSTTELDSAEACERVIAQPTPTIGKTVTSSSVDGTSGDWTIVYDVTVTNPSAQYVTTYDLRDELHFGAGITVVSAQVASGDATVSGTWNGLADTSIVSDVALAASAVHHYTVTVVATPPAVIDETNETAMDCRIDTGETGTGFRNVAILDSGVVSPSPFAVACEPATDPSVIKTTVGAPVQDPLTGLWTLDYKLTVTNRSTTTVTGGIPYSLDDSFDFPTGVVVTGVAVQGPGSPSATFNGADDIRVASGSIEAAADESTPTTHVYTVSVTFSAPGGLTAAERSCDVNQGAGGLRNEVEIRVGVRVTADVACADVPESPVFGVSKTVLSQSQQADGTWLMFYRVSVANPSTTVAGFYDLNDRFALGDGISLVESPTIVAQPSGVTVNHANWDGSSDTSVSAHVLLGGGGTHQYTVRAVIDAADVRGSDEAGDCVLDADETGTGFLNAVLVSSGAADREASACGAPISPTITKTVTGAPVLGLDGSWTVRYAVTVVNPSPTVAVTYGLSDELDFPTGTVFGATSVTARTGGPTASVDWNGVADTEVVPEGTALAGGARHVFDVSVVATLPAGQASVVDGWANSATVASSTDGVVTDDAEAKADIELPELAISKSVTAPAVPKIGDTVTYTVTVENVGVGNFTTVYPAELWDDLVGVLDDATLDGTPTVTPAGGSLVTAGDRIHWSGALGSGQSVQIVYSVIVTGEGDQSLENIAFAGVPGTTPPTPSVGDCEADLCATTTTALPGFLLEKTASAGVVSPGDTVDYILTFTNTGAVDVTGATFSDDLSAVLDDATLSLDPAASSGTATLAGSALSWTGDLAAGESVTVAYSVVVNGPLTGDGLLENTAATDPNYATRWPAGECPNDAEVCEAPDREVTTLTAVRALAFTKVADATQVVPGGKLGYTVTVTNIGPADYTEESPATIVDSLGGVLDDAKYNADATASAGTLAYAAPALTWTGAIASGETIAFRYSVTVDAKPSGDMRLDNVIGLSSSTRTVADLAGCLAAPTDNGGAHCVVSTIISPLATTGLNVGMVSVLSGVLFLLLGFIFLLWRKRQELTEES